MSRNWLAFRVWLAVIILAASLAGAPAFAQGGAAVRVDPSALTVQVNDTANVTIKIDNVANLTAFEIHLSFDPAVLEVTSMTNGGFVAADFTAQNTFDNTAGTIDYAVAQMNRAPAQGSGILLNIAFRAKALGSSSVTTRATPAAPAGLLLADQNGMAISASWMPGTINVGTPPPVTNTPINTSSPAPSTNTPANTSTPITNTPTNTAPVSGTPTPVPGAAIVRVDPSVLSVRANNTIRVCIKVDNVARLAAFEIHLSFNPAVLEVTSLTNGGFVVADFVAQNTFDNAAGTIDYAVSQRNRSPANGSGTLLCIVFRAKANGNSTVTTRATQAAPAGLLLADPNGMAIPFSWLPGTINVDGSPDGTLGTHIVRWGEWLYCIGRAYGVSPWAIAKTNGIWWPYIIFPNQRLTIPNVPWTNMTAGPVCKAQFSISTPTPAPSPTVIPATPVTIIPPTATPIPGTTVSPPTCRAIYVVRRGDNLYRIALRYGTTYTEIARVNQIPNPRLIYSGQQLCIP
ncbi:MAG TPA: LysM peptidoglycan-binding domain-containing protein [Anaerolineales bacterium]|nr:LysM peptidoglycan-binding domain-containing protein [Anaerolineales bacterium]